MREQIERLTKLTADLLDLSQLDAGAMEIDAEDGRPRRARARGRRASSGPRRAARLALELRTPAAPRSALRATPTGSAQIIRILLDNALTHTPRGNQGDRDRRHAAGRRPS